MSRPLVVYLHSDAYDRVYQAVNTIATAASAGRRCYLLLFYHALGAFMADAWDDMRIGSSAGRRTDDAGDSPQWYRTLDRSFEMANIPSLYDLLEQARESEGELFVYACSNSTRFLGLEPADVKKRVDEIVGLATMLEISSEDCQVLYL
jgi:peroxiredoxin family protein